MKNPAKHNSFIRDTAILVSGNTGAQIITVALTPIITRLFSPETFGEFSIIMSLASPIVAIASLRYHEAIMLPKMGNEANALFRLSIYLVAFFSLFLLFITFFANDYLSEQLGISSGSKMLFAVPLLVFLIAMRRVLDADLQRSRSFKRIAGATVSVAVVDRFVSIGAGVLGYLTAWSLLAGRIIGLLASAAFMLKAKNVKNKEMQEKVSVAVVCKSYSHFAKYSWSGLLQQFDRELPLIVVAASFGPATAGLFALARRVLIEPALLVGEALSKTFYQKAAEKHRAGEPLVGLTTELVDYLLRWVIPPMVMFSCIASESFELVFGEEWAVAGTYSVYLMPWFVAGFVMQPLGRLYNVLEKQREWALYTIWKLLGTIIVLAIGVYIGSPKVMFIMLSTLVAVLSFYRAHWIVVQIGLAKSMMARLLLRTLFVALIWVAPILLIQYYLSPEKWLQILLGSVMIMTYVAILVIRDPRFNKRFQKKII